MFRPQEVLKSQSEAENYRGILSYQLTLTTSVSKQVHAWTTNNNADYSVLQEFH